jgi:O-antigen/teichoic acid export membrane protein
VRPPSDGRRATPGESTATEPPERGSFSRGAGLNVLSWGVIAAIGLATQIVTARLYGVRITGEFALSAAPTGIAWFLSSIREQPALVRELAKLPRRAPRATGLSVAVLSFSFVLTLLVCAIGAGVTVLVFNGPIHEPQLVLPAIVFLAGYLAITNTCWNLDSVFSAYRAGEALFWVRLGQAASYLVLVVAASWTFHSVWGPVLATVASWLISLAHRLGLIRRFIALRVPAEAIRDGFRALPEILRFGLKVTPGSVAEGIRGEAGTWILGVAGSVAAVGAYSRAWMVGRRLVDLSWRIGEMLLPTLVERRAAGDSEGFDRALVDTLRYTCILTLVPAAAAGGCAIPVMSLFGPGFRQGATALAVVLLMPVLAGMSTNLNLALFAADRPWRSTAIQGTGMLAAVIPAAVLTVPFGLTGTAIGMVTGYVVELVLQLASARVYVSRPIMALWPRRQLAGTVLAYAAGFAAARVVSSGSSSVVVLVAGLTAGVVAFGCVFVVVGGLLPRDRERLRLAQRGLSGRRFRRGGGALPSSPG